MAARAKCASRLECENSFTVVMLVYASDTRPVIDERAWACSCPTCPRRGTKYSMASPNKATQAMKGSISLRSKPPARAMIAMKYTPMPGAISMMVNSTSRTARAVCITLVVTRPENWSEKNDRL
ncbi:hypothetical protein D3C81_1671580 [compost metagenome]